MLRISIKYNFTVEGLANIRKLTCSKVCYKKKLTFLKNRVNLTNSVSNRIVINSEFLKSYKNLRRYYLSVLRANFSLGLPLNYLNYFLTNFDNRKYLVMFSKTHFMKEFDYVLLWKALQTNSLFNISTVITKKKKKLTFKKRVFFILPKKRLLFVWKWLSVFIRSNRVKGVPNKLSLIAGFENFLMAPDSSQILNAYKLQIYKLQLLRTI